MQRWLVTGASGQLGGHLLAALRLAPDVDVLTMGRPLHEAALCAAVDAFAPTHVVHLAAVSSPAAVAADPSAARWVNVEAAALLAACAARTGAWMLFPSTDWVHDGEADGPLAEDAACRPATAYGRLKLEAEQRVLAATPAAVARFSLMCGLPVPGADGTQRRTTWTMARERLRGGQPVRAITDELRTPLSFADAATAVVRLAGLRFCGVVNVAGPQALTPFDVFGALAASVRASHLVLPVLRRDIEGCADRPRDVTLDGALLRRLVGPVAACVGPATFGPVAASPPAAPTGRTVTLPPSPSPSPSPPLLSPPLLPA